MPAVLLSDRAIISVSGPDARAFLQNLVTCDIDPLTPGDAAFGALLTPQGKILFDFFVVCATGQSFLTTGEPSRGNPADADPRMDSRSPADAGVGNDSRDIPGDVFLIDTPTDLAPALAKRLSMYKLRAKVTIAQTADHVVAVWGDSAPPAGLVFRDTRDERLGSRVIVEGAMDVGDLAAYEAHRIALGIPQGGADFAWGEAFPHEVNMDVLHGVSFTKGCYVGQEVVSRMQHRGTTRRRILPAAFDGASPAQGAEIRAGDVLIGTFGSAANGHGLAAVRTDRLAEAQAAGTDVSADGTLLRIAPGP